MFRSLARPFVIALATLTVCTHSMAAFPFIEDFHESAENWKQDSNGLINMNYVSTGGYDGGPYISRTATLVNATTNPVASSILIRAQQTFTPAPGNPPPPLPSSNGEFVGNWLNEGIKEVTAYLRHDAGVALPFTFRFVRSQNTPGASYQTLPVQSGVWTKVTLAIIDVPEGTGQNVTYGGSNYAGVFNNDISRIQINPVIPASFASAVVTIDLDRVTVAVPEPATVALAGTAVGGAMLIARRRRQGQR